MSEKSHYLPPFRLTNQQEVLLSDVLDKSMIVNEDENNPIMIKHRDFFSTGFTCMGGAWGKHEIWIDNKTVLKGIIKHMEDFIKHLSDLIKSDELKYTKTLRMAWEFHSDEYGYYFNKWDLRIAKNILKKLKKEN